MNRSILDICVYSNASDAAQLTTQAQRPSPLGVRLRPERDGRVRRCSAWLGLINLDSMLFEHLTKVRMNLLSILSRLVDRLLRLLPVLLVSIIIGVAEMRLSSLRVELERLVEHLYGFRELILLQQGIP